MILQELMGSVSGEGNRRRLLELKANRLRQTGGQLQLFVTKYFPEKYCLLSKLFCKEGLTAKEAVKRGVMRGVKGGGYRWGVKVG